MRVHIRDEVSKRNCIIDERDLRNCANGANNRTCYAEITAVVRCLLDTSHFVALGYSE
jgi:hypothetical protein